MQNITIDLNEQGQRIYFLINSVVIQERIDKKILMFITLSKLIPDELRKKYNIDESINKYELLLSDNNKRIKIELFYSILSNQEERKLLFDEDVTNQNIYNIKFYPYGELLEIEKDIHELCGYILNDSNDTKSLDVGKVLKGI